MMSTFHITLKHLARVNVGTFRVAQWQAIE